MSFIFHPPSFSIVLHFPFPSFSTPAFLSIIFLFRHFPPLIFGPSFSFSVIFHPCFFVHHFPFPSFSFLAFSASPKGWEGILQDFAHLARNGFTRGVVG